MQELNNAKNLSTTLNIDTESCKHQPVYFGVININIDERTIGSVDVWRCGVCKKRFCEEKHGEIKHECLDEQVIPLKVNDFKVDDDKHWSFLVDDNVNKAVEI